MQDDGSLVFTDVTDGHFELLPISEMAFGAHPWVRVNAWRMRHSPVVALLDEALVERVPQLFAVAVQARLETGRRVAGRPVKRIENLISILL